MGNKFTRCLFGREPIGFGQLWVDPGGQISDRFLSVESNDCDAMRKQKGFLGMSNQWIHVNHHVCYRKKLFLSCVDIMWKRCWKMLKARFLTSISNQPIFNQSTSTLDTSYFVLQGDHLWCTPWSHPGDHDEFDAGEGSDGHLLQQSLRDVVGLRFAAAGDRAAACRTCLVQWFGSFSLAILVYLVV